MKEPRNSVTKKPENGVTKVQKVTKNKNGVAFKQSKQSKPKRLNAISFKDVTRIWLQNYASYNFWLHINLLLTSKLNPFVTNVTKIYSKTYYSISSRGYNVFTRTRVALYRVSSVFWLHWLQSYLSI